MNPEDHQSLINTIERLSNTNLALEKKVSRLMSTRYAVREVFLRALATALGATVGIALILLTINFVVEQFDIPVIQKLAEEIVRYLPER